MTTITTYDSYRKRYLVEYSPSADELPLDHWTKTNTRTDAELEAEVNARLAARGTVERPPAPVARVALPVDTYYLQIAHCVVENGSKPERDMVRINAYLRLRAERARRAKAVQAAPSGPRSDEWAGMDKPTERRSGAVNPCATGPLPVEWKEPESRPVPVFSTAESKRSLPEPVKAKEVEGTLIGTSAIGAKPANKWASSPCGPTPVEWVDPAAKKEKHL